MIELSPNSAIPIGIPMFPVLPMEAAIVVMDCSFLSVKNDLAIKKLTVIHVREITANIRGT